MKNKIVLLFCMSLFIVSCKNETNKEELKFVGIKSDTTSVVIDDHNSQNSLDWSGTYKGRIPCADCEGIATEIILNSDMTFVKIIKYLGKNENEVLEETGSFVCDKTGTIVVLNVSDDSPRRYKVGENKLIQLDIEGKAITGLLAQKYLLTK